MQFKTIFQVLCNFFNSRAKNVVIRATKISRGRRKQLIFNGIGTTASLFDTNDLKMNLRSFDASSLCVAD